MSHWLLEMNEADADAELQRLGNFRRTIFSQLGDRGEFVSTEARISGRLTDTGGKWSGVFRGVSPLDTYRMAIEAIYRAIGRHQPEEKGGAEVKVRFGQRDAALAKEIGYLARTLLIQLERDATVDAREGDVYASLASLQGRIDEAMTAIDQAVEEKSLGGMSEGQRAGYLHYHQKHPGYQYRTTFGPRKCGALPPEGDGWVENTWISKGSACFDHHDEAYWFRKMPTEGK